MEHLLLPRGAVISDDERALYVADEYDGGPFLTYPNRSRFKHIYEHFVKDGQITIYDKERFVSLRRDEIEPFIQTWLFFGLLYEIFGDLAPANSFIERHQDNSKPFITTARLGEVVRQWAAHHQPFNKHNDDLLQHLGICISKADQFCELMNRSAPKATKGNVLSAIICLRATLEDVVTETLQPGCCKSIGSPGLRGAIFAADTLMDSMTSNNWCPAEVAAWCTINPSSGLQLFHYMSKLKQPKIKDHTHCANTRCLADQYDMNQRIALHRCPGQDCEDMYVDDRKVMDILGAGHIALLEITQELDSESITISVISTEQHPDYVALSHVWADGLGNPFANALPRCQVAYAKYAMDSINSKIQSTHRNLPLWLDTLCCPVNSDVHRNICLSKMSRIYREAAYVLVLDAPLGQFKREELDCVELCARLKFSGWARRLWTLQEGIQARSLWIQLKDEAVDLGPIYSELRRLVLTDHLHVNLLMWLSNNLQTLRQLANIDRQWRPTHIVDVIHAFEERSVSVPSDEPLCLSTSLGVSETPVLEAPLGERMKAFWQSLDWDTHRVPRGIAFFAGENLKHVGFRWAPASFLHRNLRSNRGVYPGFTGLKRPYNVEDIAHLTLKGLLVQLPGLSVELPVEPSPADLLFWNCHLNPFSPYLHLREHRNKWFHIVQEFRDDNDYESSLDQRMRFDHGSHVVLLSHPISNDSAPSAPRHCLIGRKAGEAESILHFRRSEYCSLGEMTPNQTTVAEASWQIAQDDTLRKLLEPSRKDTAESPLYPDDKLLSLLPNDGVERLFDLVETSLKDPILQSLHEHNSPRAARNTLGGYAILFLTGKYGRIVHTWPQSQQWCID